MFVIAMVLSPPELLRHLGIVVDARGAAPWRLVKEEHAAVERPKHIKVHIHHIYTYTLYIPIHLYKHIYIYIYINTHTP